MADQLKLVEGISGVWHYHLARVGESDQRGLCGAKTMSTGAPLSSWGFKPSHMRHSYCDECAEKAGIKP